MRVLWITFVALGLLAGCNSGQIGEPCTGGPAEEGHCVEGAVCARDLETTEAPPDPPNAVPSFCRAVCDTQADCTEPGFECRGVVGSMIRACQPSDDGEGPEADAGI